MCARCGRWHAQRAVRACRARAVAARPTLCRCSPPPCAALRILSKRCVEEDSLYDFLRDSVNEVPAQAAKRPRSGSGAASQAPRPKKASAAASSSASTGGTSAPEVSTLGHIPAYDYRPQLAADWDDDYDAE
jgi:hypothetical protein